jgi:tripartite-type tricarboxylate transporter receptor subunit TctC
MKRRLLLAASNAMLLSVAGAGALPAHAQAIEGPLRLVVGYPPGGASDRAARLVGQALQVRHGINVIVENKPGAGGRLAAQQLRQSTAADNVLMLGNPAVMTIAPLVFKDNGYDPDADFVPVAQVTSYEFAVAVGAQVPVREVSHLIAWLKANPEKAFFGVPATGSLPHFFALMLADRAGLKADVVGYKGSAPLSTELVGGQIPVAIDTLDAVLALHQAGKVRILAVSGRARSPFDKNIPTLKEAGIDLVGTGWNAFFAPKAMPPAKAKALADAIHGVMGDPAVQQRFVAASMEPTARTQADTTAMLKTYQTQWAPVVRRSGYQP